MFAEYAFSFRLGVPMDQTLRICLPGFFNAIFWVTPVLHRFVIECVFG